MNSTRLPTDLTPLLERRPALPIDDPHVRRRAATALVLARDPEAILFMKRAERPGDPWSGQMSFPGGHSDPSDPSLEETARRETAEEVGIDLELPLGRLDDCAVHTGPHTVVTPFVFEVETALDARPCEREVSRVLWVPVRALLDPERWVTHGFRRGDVVVRFPGIRYEDETIWGLTYRCLFNFFELIGRELPTPPPVPRRPR